MAAITVVKARPCTPVGYEVVDKGTLTEDVVAGNLLVNGASGWSLAPADTLDAHGIALQDGYAGQAGFSIGIQGEMDGFSGLTPGDPLYPSGDVAGVIATDAVVGATVRIRAARTTRIRYCFV